MADATDPAILNAVPADKDLDPATLPATPYQVQGAATQAIGGTIIGIALILLTGTSTLLGFVKTHSLLEAAAWFKTTDGVAYGSAVGFVAAAAWRIIAKLRDHQRAVTLEQFAPSEVAVKK